MIDAAYENGKYEGRDITGFLETLFGRVSDDFQETAMSTKHGYYGHPLYNTWRGMISRCERTTDRWYCNYGGRGISVCREWHDLTTFIEWALSDARGWQQGLTIDRIDNNGNYYPENCRFVTRKENMRNCRFNRLVTHDGVTQPLIAWSEQMGIHKKTLQNRLNRGWTPQQALTLPLQRGKKPC